MTEHTNHKHLTVSDVREIARDHGIAHAQFCVEQEATQRGRDAVDELFRELSRLEDAIFSA